VKQEHLVYILDEQVSVGFTGRVNIQNSTNKQYYGSILMIDGDVVDCSYKTAKGLKGFFNLCVDEFDNIGLGYVVEPELISLKKRTIQFPYSVLKRKIAETVEKYRDARSNKPPKDLKILVMPGFIDSGEPISGDEFDLLGTISDFNRVTDIYEKSELLDYEITNALVSLRKKNALKVIKNKE
jgi:hypothetical protein